VTTYREIFRIREFRTLFAATSTSVAGKTMEMLAVSALVYAHTGSPLLAAIAYLGGFLPMAVGALTLMSLADRLPPRAAMVTWRVVHAGVAAVLALGILPVWGMLALLMTVGLGDAVIGGIGSAIVVDVVPEGSFVLGRSVLNVSVGAMQIVGFAVGGTLLVLVSPAGALWLTVAISLVTAAIVRFGLKRRPPRATGRASVGLTWQGNRALFGDPTLRRLLLGQWLPNGLIVGAEAMFVPYAGNAAGALFAGAAGGMLVGDVVIGRWTGPALRSRLSLPLYALLAAPYLAFAFHPGPILATALVAVASFGYAGTLTLQERFVNTAPDHLLGQGMGLAGSGMMTGQAVCAMLVGFTAELTTVSVAMTATAAASLVASLLLLGPLRPPRPVAETIPSQERAAGERIGS
jgi:MFS family permease